MAVSIPRDFQSQFEDQRMSHTIPLDERANRTGTSQGSGRQRHSPSKEYRSGAPVGIVNSRAPEFKIVMDVHQPRCAGGRTPWRNPLCRLRFHLLAIIAATGSAIALSPVIEGFLRRGDIGRIAFPGF